VNNFTYTTNDGKNGVTEDNVYNLEYLRLNHTSQCGCPGCRIFLGRPIIKNEAK
jgi:hypothetical protein